MEKTHSRCAVAPSILAAVLLGLASGAALAAAPAAPAAPPAAPNALEAMPIREVTAFKDGHAFVLHEGAMPTDDAGRVVLDYLPAPVLGTFWPYAADPKAKLTAVVAGRRRVSVERTALTVAALVEGNVGAKVRIHEWSPLRVGRVVSGVEAVDPMSRMLPPRDLSVVSSENVVGQISYEATIVGVPARSGEELARTSPPGTEERLPQKGNVVLLKTAEGIKAVPVERIESVTFVDQPKAGVAEEEFRNTLTLRLDWKGGKPSNRSKPPSEPTADPVAPTPATLEKWLTGKEVVEVCFAGAHMEPLKLRDSLKIKVADNDWDFRLTPGEGGGANRSFVEVCMRVSPENTRRLLSLQEELEPRGYRLDPEHTHVWSLDGDPNARAKAREMAPGVLAAAANGMRAALPGVQSDPEKSDRTMYLAGIRYEVPGTDATGMIRISEIAATKRWQLPVVPEQVIHLPRLGLMMTVYCRPGRDTTPDDSPQRAAIRKAVNEAIVPLLKLEGDTARLHEKPLPQVDRPNPAPATEPAGIEGKPAPQAKVGMVYLQRGIRWIPNYRIEIDGKGKAHVRLQATLVNELVDLVDVKAHLVVGVPTFAFQESVDPMSLQQAVAQLSSHFRRDAQTAYAFSNAIMSQSARAVPDRGEEGGGAPVVDLGPEIAGSAKSEDLYVFTVDHVTLRKGERMVLPVAEYDLEYKDVFVLDLPFGPPPEARTNLNSEQQIKLARLMGAPKVQHAIRLVNKAEHPLTTAPALVLRDGRLLAQGMTKYTAVGATSDLEVTTAVDIAVEKVDREVGRKPNAANWHNTNFDQIDLAGEVRLTNRRGQAVDLEVTRYILGTMDEVGQDGKLEQLSWSEGGWLAFLDLPEWWYWHNWPYWWYRFNGVGRATWKVTLEPGKEINLGYKWHYLWG